MANIQYQVREVTRWIVTRYASTERTGESSVIGHFDNQQNAHTVAASLLAHEGHDVEVTDVEDGVYENTIGFVSA